MKLRIVNILTLSEWICAVVGLAVAAAVYAFLIQPSLKLQGDMDQARLSREQAHEELDRTGAALRQLRRRIVEGKEQLEQLGGSPPPAEEKDLQIARSLFMREHKNVFKILRMMQDAYYKSDDRRERFVSLCHDVDVQRLTFEAYMNKSLVKARPLAHLKIGLKNLAHLTGLVPKVYT